jgi:hypothetical protein
MLEAILRTDDFEVWPENAEPLQIFMRLQTQWRYGPVGPVGLDYAGVQAAFDMMCFKPTPSFFEDLQVMEAAALKILAEARNGS